LVAAGVGSRRASAELIMGGRVQVNGQPVSSLTQLVKDSDRVTVDGRQTDASRSKPAYLMLHKPAGYLTTVRDDRGRRTVLALVPQESYAPGLVPVGRLDMDTTGLLLLTNDGDLAYRLTHPRYQVEKEYQVEVDGPLTRQQVQRLLSGVQLPEGPAKVVSVKPLTRAGAPGTGQMRAPAGMPRSRPASPAIARYSVTLVEGQKREVRLLFQAMGRQVLELRRVRMGTVSLGGLEQGRVRPLTQAEVQRLKGMVASQGRLGRAEGMPGQEHGHQLVSR
jgi:23S rRNA pseudouridine2605 synthase